MLAESFRVQAGIDGLAELFGSDPTGQDLQAIQSFAGVGQQRLDVVADQLEEHFLAGSAADLDEESGGREKLRQRRLDRGESRVVHGGGLERPLRGNRRPWGLRTGAGICRFLLPDVARRLSLLG